MNELDELEAASIFILREAYNRFDDLAMLWSLGKDSNVMVWLARRRFMATYRSRSFMWIRAKSSRKCTISGTAIRMNGICG